MTQTPHSLLDAKWPVGPRRNSQSLAKGESCRDVAKTFGVHHSTIARLAG